MCGRYSLQTPLTELADIFDADVRAEEAGPRYNVAPTDTVATLRRAGDRREITALRWGLVPRWSRGPGVGPLMINARSESLDSRAAFRDLLSDYRCAVLADGFYEWRTEHGLKQPYFVHRRDGSPLAFAALWDTWGDLESTTIVTTEANQLLLPLHDRMPVVLTEESLDRWLDPAEREFERVRNDLRPCAPGLLEAYPVTRRVNRTGDDDAEFVEPLDGPLKEPEAWGERPAAGSSAPDDQLGLF
ncbi:MAG: SOS response-associated peptidase [Gemmatimonadota bacterium]|nr:SOS response-associated peptidase [Gemmatimonadota bacterium]